MDLVKSSLILLGLITTASTMLTKPDGCGKDFGCYSVCDGDCSVVVTWIDKADTVDFKLSLNLETGGANQWIALGLSLDTSMGADSVTDCIMSESGTVNVRKSYNEPDVESNIPLSQVPEGISAATGGVVDGVLECTYTQTKVSTNDRVFDLTSDYHLLVAYGKASSGFKQQHSVEKLPFVTADKVDLQSKSDTSGSAVNVLVKAHGSLMMFAWIFCASIGIVLARYYKRMWPNSKVLSERPWFSFHRICMVLACLSCVTGFVIIFIEVKDWAHLNGASSWQKAHPIIGVIVTALVILNPIMAAFRPHPDAKRRKYFNWAHWFVGTVAHILSVLALVIGVTLAKASAPFYIVWILVAWAAYQVLVELFLEIHECMIAGSRDKYNHDGSQKDPRGSTLKKIMLGLHIIIITAFTIVCIVILCIN